MKDYDKYMHTTEHVLNQTMIRTFGCGRSVNAHIEKKKSKCDYLMAQSPTEEQMAGVEQTVNEVLRMNLPVTESFVTAEYAEKHYDTGKLPESAGNHIRIVHVGDYDDCCCIGPHVSNTGEIGAFRIISYEFNEGRLRVRFKLDEL